ncbi:hypothetical protein O8B93_27465 [Agrobacterium rhizogenes]|nr:hypothetical protein [Rhizobium rhizogenes]MCZ7451304.1 hypothetical protein [Rhizobium rhizogenes]
MTFNNALTPVPLDIMHLPSSLEASLYAARGIVGALMGITGKRHNSFVA